ncbi:hypothetical protein FOA52_002192 [Chlamydomonas sp. UWO 241]|nr:hypothetical protein FOA52_002192 [Chlamydomonas sp. UWO 241]
MRHPRKHAVAAACSPKPVLQNESTSDSEEGKAQSCSTNSEEADVCWICLDGSDEPDNPLCRPCSCPRYSHAPCLARWQLQSAGSRKETACEFCSTRLPDWRLSLTPEIGLFVPAIMNVNFGGIMFSFEVKAGPRGYADFAASIRHAFSLPDGCELNITFTCDEPSTGAPFTIHGARAYDAAVHCASISAARRALAASAGSSALSSADSASTGDGATVLTPHARDASDVARKRSGLGDWGKRVRGALANMLFPYC